MTLKHEAASQLAQFAPPGAVVGSHYFLGLPLAEWVTIATGVYVVLQIVYLAPKVYERYTGKEHRNEPS